MLSVIKKQINTNCFISHKEIEIESMDYLDIDEVKSTYEF